jgi:oligoendopeptidase F
MIVAFQITAAQEFNPIPEYVKNGYRFNFQRNFYKDSTLLKADLKDLGEKIATAKIRIVQMGDHPDALSVSLEAYDDIERQYRKLDLYFFLRYAIDMGNERAMVISDSIRGEMGVLRTLVKDKVNALPQSITDAFIDDGPFGFYVWQIRSEAPHLLTESQLQTSSFFDYVKDNSFYDRALQHMTFYKVQTAKGEIDLVYEMSRWQNHPDPLIRREAEQKYFAGYATQREALGCGYIDYIKGLNAFSKLKGFEDLLDEKSFYSQLPNTVIENFFDAILKSRTALVGEDNFIPRSNIRVNIVQATETITRSLAILGSEYRSELEALLDPRNGRIDIVGGQGRIPIRGTASAYPVSPSIFYALNYEGYLIDLTLLAHEAGHAVQASMMHKYQVPMVYARGPAYFTESFGNFNELLIFDHLFRTETDVKRKKIYHDQLMERLQVLYGSAEEAYIEYYLIKGIIAGDIRYVDDLDTVTWDLGVKINPTLYKNEPFRKGTWMLLDSSFREPGHNVHDMIASALAIQYFAQTRSGNPSFIPAYLAMLKNGYKDTPGNILKTIDIDITDAGFIESVLALLQKEPQNWKF